MGRLKDAEFELKKERRARKKSEKEAAESSNKGGRLAKGVRTAGGQVIATLAGGGGGFIDGYFGRKGSGAKVGVVPVIPTTAVVGGLANLFFQNEWVGYALNGLGGYAKGRMMEQLGATLRASQSKPKTTPEDLGFKVHPVPDDHAASNEPQQDGHDGHDGQAA